MARFKTQKAVSAGGVVLRECDDRVEVVLVGQTVKGTWGLPKGGPSKGETLEETAVRETTEETGLAVRILAPIDSIDYWFIVGRKRIHKTVHYFLMKPIGGDISRHDAEYDRVEWVPVDEAYARMSFPNEVDLVRKGYQIWSKNAGDKSQSAANE